MSEIQKDNKLFSEFPPVTTQEWEEKINKDLKGADYERKLVWRTNEGFKVRPYYRNEDLEKVNYLDVAPKEFPFVRSNKIDGNFWFIRQDIIVENADAANKKAKVLFTKGVDSFGFVINNGISKNDIDVLLTELPLDKIEINFVTQESALIVIKALKELGLSSKINGSITFDPIGYLPETGKIFSNDITTLIVEVVKEAEEFKNFRCVTVRGNIFENAGSSIVQELGFLLAAAAEYMTILTDNGISTDSAAKAIKFQFATGSNYFMEIAKIRAARLLWANIVKQYNPENTDAAVANIHAVTSDWNKTIYDPYVNMLRTQTEAMSSILGGVNSMNVKGFNAVYEQPTDFSERIARNQQLLLKEESHFDKVVDPGAGSYYIEMLTDSIAEQAWRLFIEVEDKGGFIQAVKDGFVQNIIKETAAKRDMDIANRKENFLGVNQFPNFTEYIEKDIDKSMFEKPVVEKVDAEPLVKYRGAMAIEALRYKTDEFSKKNKRPLAFMLTIGNLNMRKARAQFACNFFAVAGFSVQDNNGFDTVEEGVKAASAADADIIVICSSDDEYAELAPKLKKEAGDKIVVVAGYPKSILDNLKDAGLEYFIHVKSNLLETLTDFQNRLGI
jgi:methylmalonyl-CoA mutase